MQIALELSPAVTRYINTEENPILTGVESKITHKHFNSLFNPFSTNVALLFSMKTENLWYRNGTLVENVLIIEIFSH